MAADCLPYTTYISPTYIVLYIILNSICVAASGMGNSIVIYLVLKVKRLGTPSNWLLLFMATSDLSSAVLGQSFLAMYVSFWLDSPDYCFAGLIGAFFSATSCSTSMLILCGIARDRLLHLDKKLNYSLFTNKKQVCYIGFSCWIIGAGFGSTFLITGDSWESFIGFACFFSLSTFSFIYIGLTYRKIQTILRQHTRDQLAAVTAAKEEHNDGTVRSSTVTNQSNITVRRIFAVQKKAVKSMLIIMALFVAVWTPFLVVMAITFIRNIMGIGMSTLLRKVFLWTSIMSYVNGAMNPLIYATRYREIGGEMKKLFACKRVGYNRGAMSSTVRPMVSTQS